MNVKFIYPSTSVESDAVLAQGHVGTVDSSGIHVASLGSRPIILKIIVDVHTETEVGLHGDRGLRSSIFDKEICLKRQEK